MRAVNAHSFPTCRHAKFGRSKSNGTSVRIEMQGTKRLASSIFKVTQGYPNRTRIDQLLQILLVIRSKLVTIDLSRRPIVSEINCDFGRKSYFYTP